MLIYYTQTYLPPYILYYHYCYMSSKQSNVKDKNERKNTHPKPFLIKVYRYHFIREWIKKPIVDVANKKKFSKNKKKKPCGWINKARQYAMKHFWYFIFKLEKLQ